MDKSLFDKYIEEMKRMSQKATPHKEELRTVPAVAEPAQNMSGEGYLLVNVTSVRGLYPVARALVTVFRGNIDDMEKITEGYTDESGKTGLFVLPAPPASLAQDSDSQIPPYATYNIVTRADGFIDTINYNAPVFDKVTSIQNVNLIPRTSMDGNGTVVIDEYDSYTL